MLPDSRVPEPLAEIHRGPDDLLVRLNCTGLCMSDVHYMLKDLGIGREMEDFRVRSPGHEGAGVVVKVRLYRYGHQ